ncbi:MAG: lysoplasmalogenase [Anaerolineales bacterium]
MSYVLIGFALVIAAINWLAVAKKWVKIEYITKPVVPLALIFWLILNGGFQGQLIFFVIGLIFSLVGDIFLMLPNEKFVAALVSFLFAHIAFILGFSSGIPNFSAPGLILFILVGLNAFEIYRRISNGLRSRGQESFITPVLIYAIVISLMLVSALLTMVGPNSEWNPFPSMMVSFGALFFVFSDTLLAWNKFVNPIKYGDIFVIVTYHLALITITLGAGINFQG